MAQQFLGRNQIVSRRNGLVIALPTTPMSNNIRQRFNLKGDNELIFEQATAPVRSTFEDGVALTDEAVSASELGDVM